MSLGQSQSGKMCKKDRQAGLPRSKAPQFMSPSKESTHFFKVILPSTIEENKLRIPEKFVRKFGNELSAISKVTTPNGCTSNLGLHKSGNSIWFLDGWQEFMKHNSISTGYFLVFRYEGNSNFHVLIFDMTATEIDYPHNDENNKDYAGIIVIPTDSSTDKYKLRPDGYNTRSKRRKLAIQEQIIHVGDDMNSARHSCLELTPVSMTERLPEDERSGEDEFLTKSICYYSNSKSPTPEQRQDVINAAKLYRPRNPNCMLVVRPYNIYNYMGVPAKFASMFFRGTSELLNLKGSGKRKWETRLYYGGGRYKIGKGWAAFARDNKLEEGDVCIFELIKGRGNIEMKVKVFHVSDFVRP